jgi:hypothetical protein
MSYTTATLTVSREAWNELAEKLMAAGYAHAFSGCAIDLHGISLEPEGQNAAPMRSFDDYADRTARKLLADRPADVLLQNEIRQAIATAMGYVAGGNGPIGVEGMAHHLVQRAEDQGLVLTIEQRPLKPLAMGHHETAISVRPARGAA